MRFALFVLLTTISSACISDANDVSHKVFMEMLTDEHRISVFKSYIDAIEKDIPIAEGGDSVAMYRLYKNFNLIANIHKIDGASVQALKWLQQSAELEHPEALRALGHIHMNGDENFNIEKDLAKAAEYFKSAWDKGDKSAKNDYMYIIECKLPDEKAWDC